jgi:hypothetical protein
LLLRTLQNVEMAGNSCFIRRDKTPLRGILAPAEIEDVGDLTRTRTQVAREGAQHIQRIQKTLENVNIKLTSVISNVIGTSGRRVLKAMIAGETNPASRIGS